MAPKRGPLFRRRAVFFPRILTGSGVLAMGQLLGKVVPRHDKGGLRARDCGTPPASNACGMDKISPWIVIELHALLASPRLSLQCGCTSLDCQRSFPFSAHVPFVCDRCPHRRVLRADTCYMLGRKRHMHNDRIAGIEFESECHASSQPFCVLHEGNLTQNVRQKGPVDHEPLPRLFERDLATIASSRRETAQCIDTRHPCQKTECLRETGSLTQGIPAQKRDASLKQCLSTSLPPSMQRPADVYHFPLSPVSSFIVAERLSFF